MTETEERLMRMMEQQQALTAALIAQLSRAATTLPPTTMTAAPEVARIAESIAAEDAKPRMRIADILPLFTQSHKGTVKESTRVCFVNNLNCSKWTKTYFGDKYLDELDWLTVQNWLDSVEVHTRYLCDYIRDLKRLINWARERGKCRTPPEYPRPFRFKRFEKRHGEEIDDEVFVELRRCCLRNYGNDIGAAAALIAMFTGLRIGEVCGLRVGDIDFAKRTLTVARTVERCIDTLNHKSEVVINTPKTRSSARTIPVADVLMDALRDLCDGLGKDDYILQPSTGGVFEPRLLRQHYNNMLKRYHIGHYKFHCLRHTFVSRHIRAGINPKAVSAYVGHADLKMTLGVYTHLNEDDMRAVVTNKAEGAE